MKLHWQILIAVALAAAAGSITESDTVWFGLSAIGVYAFLGALFLNALKMLVVPLVVASILSAMAGIGNTADFGRLGAKTLAYFLSTSLLAIVTGLILANAVIPGEIEGRPAGDRLGLSEETASVLQSVENRGAGDLAELLLRMIPPNIVAAAVNGDLLGLIFFSLLAGYFLARAESDHAATVIRFVHGVFEVMMRVTDWVMRFAPIGVFGLVAKAVSTAGLEAMQPLAWFVVTVVGGLALHAFLTLPVLVALLGRVNPYRYLRAILPALATAFATASSAATLPVTLKTVQENGRVSARTSGFVLPLGATVNMDGTALYECVAVLFIAQAYGLELSLATQAMVVFLALVTSIGVAGIPAASLAAIAIILSAVGLPLEGIGMILAVDRVLDMCRTSVNVLGDACGAMIIARSEGEEGLLTETQRP